MTRFKNSSSCLPLTKLSRLGLLFAAIVSVVAEGSLADEMVFVDDATDPVLDNVYVGTEDTMILSNQGGNQDQNYGADNILEVGAAFGDTPKLNGRRHTLIRFDVTSLQSLSIQVDSVTLRLTRAFVPAGASGWIQVHRLSDENTGWVEGKGEQFSIGTPDLGESTWNQRVQGSENWVGSAGASMEGVDYEATVLAAASFDETTTVMDLVFTDVSVLHDWSEQLNSGLLLKTAAEINGNRIGFYSSDHPTLAWRPQLIVNYSPITEVEIDIIPSSINAGSNSVVPVAIFSSNVFDATNVDPTTVTLADAQLKIRGNGNFAANVQDYDGDGLLDMMVQIDTSQLQLVDVTEATLKGRTFAGQAFQGTDVVSVVP